MKLGSKLTGLGVVAVAGWLHLSLPDGRSSVAQPPSRPDGFGVVLPGPGGVSPSYMPSPGVAPPVMVAPPSTETAAKEVPQSWRNAELIELTILPKTRRGSPVAVLGFRLRNVGSGALKDAEIACDFLAESGTRMAQVSRTAFRLIPGKRTITVDEINFGFVDPQARSVTCVVTKADDA